jgi:hypothetical protein
VRDLGEKGIDGQFRMLLAPILVTQLCRVRPFQRPAKTLALLVLTQAEVRWGGWRRRRWYRERVAGGIGAAIPRRIHGGHTEEAGLRGIRRVEWNRVSSGVGEHSSLGYCLAIVISSNVGVRRDRSI